MSINRDAIQSLLRSPYMLKTVGLFSILDQNLNEMSDLFSSYINTCRLIVDS